MRVLSVPALAVITAPLVLAPEAAANVRVPVPAPGEVSITAVTTNRPPAGSKRASRVLRVANARRLSSNTAVYATPAPDCSPSTRGRRFTALVVVTRRSPDRGGARSVTLAGRGRRGSVQGCGSYALRSKLPPAAVRRLRCDALRRARGALLLGAAASCIGAVERQLERRSPYQVPLNLELNTGDAPGPPSARNVGGTATFAGEVSPGRFRYRVALLNNTPRRYAGVPSVALDLSIATMTFASGTSEDDPNVNGGTQELSVFSCRVQVSPGLPAGLTCFEPGGTTLLPRYDLEVDFDRQLAPGSPLLLLLTSPRYGDATTSYVLDVS